MELMSTYMVKALRIDLDACPLSLFNCSTCKPSSFVTPMISPHIVMKSGKYCLDFKGEMLLKF